MSGKEKTNGSLAMAPRVITIPAASQENTRKLRVAAYARVSSNSEDQKHSFAAQNAYYSKLITGNPDWELADIYADQGITGTSIDKRDDFLRMMEDCRKGRIDRILVKSSSRFARNTKESLEAVRELAALGVSVYFEEQNIDTAQVSGEVLTRIDKGRFSTNKAPFGYMLADGRLEINTEEAEVVKEIFDMSLQGESISDIAKRVSKMDIPTRDKTSYWQGSSILYILHNEKYAGDCLLQKTYTAQELPRFRKRNLGKYRQVFVKQSHPAIIEREKFERVQELLSKKIKCAECGSTFRLKKVRGKNYWTCMAHEKDVHKCSMLPLPEEQVLQAFLRLYYKLKYYGIGVLTQLISDFHAAKTGSLLWSENIVEINKQISDIASQERLLTQLKQQGSVDPDIFISRGNLLAERRRELKLQKERILRSEEDHTIQQTQDLLDVLESGPDWLDDFDEQLFSDLVEKIVVVDNEKLRFRLLNGLEVTEKIERTQR